MSRFSTPNPPSQPPFMVWNLDLNDDGSTPHDKSFIRLPSADDQRGSAIRFRILVGSTASIDARFHTNYPLDGSHYERTKFHQKQFTFGSPTELICEFRTTRPGPYQYYITYKGVGDRDDPSSSAAAAAAAVSKQQPMVDRIYQSLKDKQTPISYFLVDPQLTLSGRPLHLDGIVLQTANPKWMGPMSNWSAHFAQTRKMGYNMVHFIPMQKRGGSNSPYSLYSQLEISDDLFEDKKLPADVRIQKLQESLLEMKHKHGMLAITDMVWNHTAYNSEWLREHPESGFNLENSPHLRSAYELDKALSDFSRDVESYGLNRMVKSVQDVERMMDVVDKHVIKPLNLWQFYVIDVEASVEAVRNAWDNQDKRDNVLTEIPEQDKVAFGELSGTARTEWLRIRMLADNEFVMKERYGRKLDVAKTISVLRELVGVDSIDKAVEQLRSLLDLLNVAYYQEYDEDMTVVHNNTAGLVKYERLDQGSWKYGKPVDESYRIVDPLFTTVQPTAKDTPDDRLHLANNGWIWGDNPLDNFAGPQSKAYLRREVLVWGDCVKLNYGKRPSDNPWLWSYMREYTIGMAKLFQGFRIDNCHSTPIELAEYLLNEARIVNENLYVAAELFTGSESTDREFVQRLGINSLIREAMQAWNPHEMSRLAHRFGGRPIGSLAIDCLGEPGEFTERGRKEPAVIAPLSASLPHAIFFDCTHDNKAPYEIRSMEDALPNSAIVAMTCCAMGSTRGYDELYPKHLNVVHEKRKYALLDDPETVGMGKAKKLLNELHQKITSFQEVHVHQESEYVTIHRVNPETRHGMLMVAHCAFPNATESASFEKPKLYGTEIPTSYSFRLRHDNSPADDDENVLCGLPARLESLGNAGVKKHMDSNGKMYSELSLPEGFGPGSILVVQTAPIDFKPNLDWKIRTCAEDAVDRLSLGALNAALYRCEAEEQDTIGQGAYNVPGLGALTYCGTQGWYNHLKHIIPANDLGHPLCAHLRSGTWSLEYVSGRLHKYAEYFPELATLAAWFEERWALVKRVPSFLIPRYFALTVHTAHQALLRKALELMPGSVVRSSRFTQELALTSVQMMGHVNSTGLRPLNDTKAHEAMAAGLPHFAIRHMRCWGRDVFIALEGLLLATGRFREAKEHIIAFGSTLKHGLIPNLLDSGRYPRYNSRDAAWFWLHAVQTYFSMAPDGHGILDAQVSRRFPDGETFVEWDSGAAFSCTCSVAELIYEILSKHARGIRFREWNAGPSLDEHMRDAGFDIEIGVDFDTTGFVRGGNEWNCGTWMDKMGSSTKASIQGIPATPRNGAAIEIIGLQKAALRWVSELYEQRKFQFEGVEKPDGSQITFRAWDQLVQQNFEKHFWVPVDVEDDQEYHVNSSIVNRRGIYKDTYGATAEWADYQFRPNISVAMVVAPELFDQQHALVCLHKMGALLQGPLGMRTLDPSDNRYRPYYDNANDSGDPMVSHGINYHQGPEWLWPTSYYLRAQLEFVHRVVRKRSEGEELSFAIRTVYHELHAMMGNLKHHITTSDYAGLPELTNKDGAYCRDSCQTQAWSSGCLLMALHELGKFERDVHKILSTLE